MASIRVLVLCSHSPASTTASPFPIKSPQSSGSLQRYHTYSCCYLFALSWSRHGITVVRHDTIRKPHDVYSMFGKVLSLLYSLGFSGETRRCTQWWPASRLFVRPKCRPRLLERVTVYVCVAGDSLRPLAGKYTKLLTAHMALPNLSNLVKYRFCNMFLANHARAADNKSLKNTNIRSFSVERFPMT